jgi:tRNA(Ile)-lysidine synthase
LLHALYRERRLLRCTLQVAHVDHALRPASKEDAAFVAQLATNCDLPFHSRCLGKLPRGANLEQWAREQRYAYFEQLRQKEKVDWVLTAHHANDVAETFLMRLLSNREPRSILACDRTRLLLRPLLLVSRESIERYALRHSLAHVEDESNLDTDFMRNRVRQQLIPLLLREYSLGSVENLTRRALASAADSEILDQIASQFNDVLKGDAVGSKLWLGRFRKLLPQVPEALAWRVIDQAFLPLLGFRLGREKSQSVLHFIASNGAQLRLPGATSLLRSKGALVIKRGVA